jgi:hypothetical protein
MSVLDPVRRDRYITKAWDAKYVTEGMDRMKTIVSVCIRLPRLTLMRWFSTSTTRPAMTLNQTRSLLLSLRALQ